MWRVVGSPLVAPTGSGVLDGVQLAVKDLIPVAGHRVGAGDPVKLAESPPAPAHAPVLAQLLAAGAIRVPASYCGLQGLRPTHGAVPLDDVLPVAVAPAALVDGLPVGLAVLGAAGADAGLTGLLAAWGRTLRPPAG